MTASPPIRIAFCITELSVGGAERCLTDLALGLDRGRFDPVVYSLGPAPPTPRNILVRELFDAGLTIHFLEARSVRQFPRVLHRLTALLRQQRPAVLQTFLFHANLVGRLAARRAGVPHVVCGLRVAERCRRWHLWFDRATSGMVDCYVCVSQAVADFAASAGGLKRAKLTVIPTGVDFGRLHIAPVDYAELGLSPERRLITYAGRLDRQKGVEWLLRIASRFLNELPQHDLLIVGDGPRAARLRRLATQLGLEARVRFVGWQGNVPGILAISDLVVLPSAWEGMPRVVLEAMACQRPVVATDVEGVRELLGPLAEAQIAPPGDSDTFVHNVVQLARNLTLAADVGRDNRERAMRFFSLPRMVAEYQNLYESLAGKEQRIPGDGREKNFLATYEY